MKIEDVVYKEDGRLVWSSSKGRAKEGEEVGWIATQGYRETAINGKRLKVHHVVWFLHHGYFPKMLDHINGNRLDNRIENLRECSHQTNACNRHNFKNRGLPRNVYTTKNKGQYRVCLTINGENKSFGIYQNVEEAANVAEQLRKKYYGEFRGKGQAAT